ncbi:MAG TPA: hypothetical protein VG713_10105 [Pirellulales bacterium]|nr:hypothetical protein [Pirellulales bacterium]
MRCSQAVVRFVAVVSIGTSALCGVRIARAGEFTEVADESAAIVAGETVDRPGVEPLYDDALTAELTEYRQSVVAATQPSRASGLSSIAAEAAAAEQPATVPSSGSYSGRCGGSFCCPRPCAPCWTVRVGTLFLDRSRPSNSNILTSTFAPGSTPILNANQLQPNTGWGYDVSALRRNVLGSDYTLEARYFGVYGFNSSFGPFTSPTGSAIQYVVPLGNVVFPEVVSASYASQLQSAELNTWRPRSGWLFPLVGFRYVDLTERGLSTIHNVGPGLNLATNRVNAFNRLFGAQVGLDGYLYQRRRLSFSGVGKAGVYGNTASNSVLLTQTAGPTFGSSASQGNAAFVGEVGLTGQYRLSNAWSLRATYELLWLDGVALATDQVRVSNPGFGTATVATNTVFYHGAFLGVEYRK